MKRRYVRRPVVAALVLAGVAGCAPNSADTNSQTNKTVLASVPVPPPKPPAFNPNDIEETFSWFLSDRRLIEYDYQRARDATINPLVEEPMAAFSKMLGTYEQSLTKLQGKRVRWIATVESIDKKRVKVRCYASGYIDPAATSTRAAKYYLGAFVNAEEEHFKEYGHSSHEKEWTLKLNEQIDLDFARTLRFGDKILLTGTIAGAFASSYGTSNDVRAPDKIEIFIANAVRSTLPH